MKKLFLLPLMAISLASCQTSGGYTQLKDKQVLTVCFGNNDISYFNEEYTYLAYKEIKNGIAVQQKKKDSELKTNTFKGNNITWVIWEN